MVSWHNWIFCIGKSLLKLVWWWFTFHSWLRSSQLRRHTADWWSDNTHRTCTEQCSDKLVNSQTLHRTPLLFQYTVHTHTSQEGCNRGIAVISIVTVFTSCIIAPPPPPHYKKASSHSHQAEIASFCEDMFIVKMILCCQYFVGSSVLWIKY